MVGNCSHRPNRQPGQAKFFLTGYLSITMLHLQSETDPAWVSAALAGVETILLDHAHCEKKAASTAMGLIFRYQDRYPLMRPLSELAREELEHFELMLDVLEARDIPFERMHPSPYAGRLMKAVRSEEPLRLLDTLIACAFIEARSCERMKLLSQALPDPELAALYKSLLASEARHNTTYIDLARGFFPEEDVRERIVAIGAREAAVILKGAPELRLHS